MAGMAFRGFILFSLVLGACGASGKPSETYGTTLPAAECTREACTAFDGWVARGNRCEPQAHSLRIYGYTRDMQTGRKVGDGRIAFLEHGTERPLPLCAVSTSDAYFDIPGMPADVTFTVHTILPSRLPFYQFNVHYPHPATAIEQAAQAFYGFNRTVYDFTHALETERTSGTGFIAGTALHSDDDRYLEGATVRAIPGGAQPYYMRGLGYSKDGGTNDGGTFFFLGVAPGRYELEITHGGRIVGRASLRAYPDAVSFTYITTDVN
jgi:hypothetical protein